MLTPEKQGVAKDKDKADTKRLARCGKCINCKSQVRRFIPCTLDSLNAGITGSGVARAPGLSPALHSTSLATPSAASAAPNRPPFALRWPASNLITVSSGTLQDCGNCYNCADKPKFGGPGAHTACCMRSLPPACVESASRPLAALAPNLAANFSTCNALLAALAVHPTPPAPVSPPPDARPPAHAFRHQEAGMHQPQVLAHGAAR